MSTGPLGSGPGGQRLLGPDASFTLHYVEMETVDQVAVLEALRRQGEPDTHDRSLIVERLSWTPQQRLEANAAFLRFYLQVRHEGH